MGTLAPSMGVGAPLWGLPARPKIQGFHEIFDVFRHFFRKFFGICAPFGKPGNLGNLLIFVNFSRNFFS